MTTLLTSLNEDLEYGDDDSAAWAAEEELEQSQQGESPFRPPEYAEPTNDDFHQGLDEDFTCSSHSMDMLELMNPAQQSQLEEVDEEGSTGTSQSFHDSFEMDKALGEGAFGTVHRCYELTHDGRKKRTPFAVKAVPMDKYNHDEIEILDELMECPTITQIKDVFYENDQSYIVMEEMEGGELLDRISEKEFYTEMEAKILFRTLLETIQFCHSRGIAHCDIKPENILLRYKDEDTSMQLADFGLAKRFATHDGRRIQLFDMNGSAEYAAPEVFNRPEDDDWGYDERCDIWSCGIVLYILLAGYAPFDSDSPYETIRKVGTGKFKFHRHYWKHISLEAKILIVKMLQVNPDERCSLEEALESPWFDDIYEDQDQC